MKATVTLEGTVEEIYEAMAKLVGSKSSIAGPRVPDISSVWASDDIRTVFMGMTAGAKEIFRAIASHDGPCPINSLMDELGLDGNGIGGRMSSPTRQMRIHGFTGYPSPVSWKNYPAIGIAYQMNPAWRRFLEQESER